MRRSVDEEKIEAVFQEYGHTGRLTPVQLKLAVTRLLGKPPLETDTVAMCSEGGCTLDLLREYCIAQRPPNPLATLFGEADKENSGCVELKDLLRAAEESCGTVGRRLMARLLGRIDRDGDGLISLSDLELCVSMSRQSRAAPLSRFQL